MLRCPKYCIVAFIIIATTASEDRESQDSRGRRWAKLGTKRLKRFGGESQASWSENCPFRKDSFHSTTLACQRCTRNVQSLRWLQDGPFAPRPSRQSGITCDNGSLAAKRRLHRRAILLIARQCGFGMHHHNFVPTLIPHAASFWLVDWQLLPYVSCIWHT